MTKFIKVVETASITYKNNKKDELERTIFVNVNQIEYFTDNIIITNNNRFGLTVKETKEEILKKIKGE